MVCNLIYYIVLVFYIDIFVHIYQQVDQQKLYLENLKEEDKKKTRGTRTKRRRRRIKRRRRKKGRVFKTYGSYLYIVIRKICSTFDILQYMYSLHTTTCKHYTYFF